MWLDCALDALPSALLSDNQDLTGRRGVYGVKGEARPGYYELV